MTLSLTVRDEVTRQVLLLLVVVTFIYTSFEEKGEQKRTNRTDVVPAYQPNAFTARPAWLAPLQWPVNGPFLVSQVTAGHDIESGVGGYIQWSRACRAVGVWSLVSTPMSRFCSR